MRKIFAAYLVTYLGTAMAPIAMAFGVLELTGSAKDTAIVVSASMLAMVVVVVFGGALADRTSRKKVIVLSEATAMVAQLCIAALFLSDTAAVWNLTILAAFNGAAMGLNGPATVGLIPEIVDKKDLQQTNAILGIARNGSMIAGAALGGLLVALVGAGFTFLIDGLSFGISALLVWTLHTKIKPTASTDEPKPSMIEDLKVGWREFISHTWLWVIVIQFAFVVGAFQSLVAVIGPAISNLNYNGAQDWGFVLSGLAAGLLVGGLIGFRIKPKHPLRLATICVFFYSLVPIALSAQLPLVWVAVAAFLSGITSEIFVVLWVSTLQRKIPQHLMSRVSAYDYLGSLCLTPLALVVAGLMFEALGAKAVLYSLIAVIIVPTLIALAVKDVWSMTLD